MKLQKNALLPMFTLSVLLASSGCASSQAPSSHAQAMMHGAHGQAAEYQSHGKLPGLETQVMPLSAVQSLHTFIDKLVNERVVFVGERHDDYTDHLNQLEIIRGLHERDIPLAIGVEFFQQPFQHALDRYISGEIDEKTFLIESEYFNNWRMDYQLYRPIMKYAQEHAIPVIALDIPRSIVRKVSREGLDSLTEEERALIPAEIDRSDERYRESLKQTFMQHNLSEVDPENFVKAQLVRDEVMAQRAVDYLKENPQHHMVILAGEGHITYRSGIPNRLDRRLDTRSITILNNVHDTLPPDVADYVLFSNPQPMPRSGRLGIIMAENDEGVNIASFSPHASAAEAAGLKARDILLEIEGSAIRTMADLKIALMDKKPGDEVSVKALRKHWLVSDKELDLKITLR